MTNDRIAFKNSFSIDLIQTKKVCRFIKSTKQLDRQAQGGDLQKADGALIMPTLCSYIGDTVARANPMHVKLDYCMICHLNCSFHEHVAGMALQHSALDHNRQGWMSDCSISSTT